MERVRLGDICEVKWGDTSKTKASYVADGFPAFSASGRDGFLPYFDHEGPGIVLSAIGAQCGKTWFTDGEWACIKNTIYLKSSSPNADVKYVFYATADPAIWPKRGAAQPFISQTDARNIEIELPALPVQQRIAGILSAYDELIENSQRRIRILEEMARALYREWFVNFRFPGHERLPSVASPFGAIPQGWEVVPIEDVCTRVTDGSHFSPKSVDEGLPMASSKDMHDWGLNLDTCRLIGREDFADLVRNDCKPKRGDVLVTKDGANYLKFIFVTRAEQEVVLLSSVAMLRPNTRINPHLLAAILKEPENKSRLKNYVTGAAIPRVILKDFKRFELLLPSEDVQEAWTKIAEPMIEQIWQLVDRIQNLRRTRDLLLPRLLSGPVELAVAEAEAEAVAIETTVAAPAASVATTPAPVETETHAAPAPAESDKPDARSPNIDATDRTDVLCTIRQVFSEGGERDRDTALRDIATALGYQRLGARVREVLSNDLLTAVRRGIVDSENGAYKIRFRSIDDCTRDSLKEAFESAIGHGWIEREEAIRTFTRWAGYARTGEVIAQTTRSLINGLIRENRLETDGPRIRRV